MEQQDYLMRQFNILGRVLGRMLSDLVGLKSQGKMVDGIEVATQALKSELDIDINELVDIPTNDFVEFLVSEKDYTNDNLDKLAEILLMIADHEEDEGWSRKLYEKVLTIYLYLEETDNVFSLDRQWKIERIKNIL